MRLHEKRMSWQTKKLCCCSKTGLHSRWWLEADCSKLTRNRANLKLRGKKCFKKCFRICKLVLLGFITSLHGKLHGCITKSLLFALSLITADCLMFHKPPPHPSLHSHISLRQTQNASNAQCYLYIIIIIIVVSAIIIIVSLPQRDERFPKQRSLAPADHTLHQQVP